MRDEMGGGPGGSGGSPEAPLPLEIELDVCRYVNEALGRFGASGRVWLDGARIALDVGTQRSHAPLGSWVRRWPELSEVSRRHHTGELARQLVQPRALSSARQETRRALPWSWGLAALALSAVAVGTYWGRSPPAASARDAAPPGALVAAAREREARDARVCEATRARVLRGATIGVTETDGWVVEIWGMRRRGSGRLSAEPALGDFVQEPGRPEGSAFTWKEEPELARVVDSSTRVTVSDEPISGAEGQPIPALRVTFHGNFVEPYFDPEQRPRFHHIAHGLAQSLELTHVGVYARCSAGRTHHLGSWFRGEDDAAAAATLLYTLGTYAEPPHLASAFLHPPGAATLDRLWALSQIEGATAHADRALLASVFGRQSALITGKGGKGGEGVVIAFPFRDGHRASRASRELARLLHLNSD